jgi:two-component system NtrC family sensor kinase
MPQGEVMPNWTSKLGFKLMLWLIGSMVIAFAVLGYQFVKLHKRHLEETVIGSAERISDVIKRSTRYSMLKNHRDEVYQTITAIGAQPSINKIRIFNEEGKISFSTDESEVNTFVDKKAEACYACHAQEQPLTRLNRPDRMRIYMGATGERILGLINPIENEPSCYNAPCHAHPPGRQVLGVLDVDLSLARVDETIVTGQNQMVSTFIAAILMISLFLTGLIWMMVHQPVKHLITGTTRVAVGDLDYKINVSSGDEIGELAASFNRMTHELKQAHVELTEWAKTLETRVDQKTTELKKAHEQMIRAERMASIGKLAAIVAHEINNPLAGILTYAKLLLKRVESDSIRAENKDEVKQHLGMIASESARCGDIVKNLLQFARQSKANFQPSDANEIIRQSVRLVQHKIDLMSLQTRIRLDDKVPVISCDAQQIKQALVALLINACEAMKQGDGVLEVESQFLVDERMVEIIIRDQGIGMDEETQKHIFEPFFTTKDGERSLGLGLAVVQNIISRHGGQIEFHSARGQGTTFILRLPEAPTLNGDGKATEGADSVNENNQAQISRLTD